MKSADAIDKACPCGSGRQYDECCRPILEGRYDASTAEQLMRSRYTAFVLCDEQYLRLSWHPDTCPMRISACEEEPKWLGLKIMSIQGGLVNEEKGVVEFVARYKIGGRAFRLHETSRFVRLYGKWVYLDGQGAENRH